MMSKVFRVKISKRWLALPFHRCDVDFVLEKCGGKCCLGGGNPRVFVHDDEIVHIEGFGASVQNNFLQAVDGKCPFLENGLCAIHFQGKPFECSISPFTLSKQGGLIVRHRYIFLPCHRLDAPSTPAHQAFAASLKTLFGDAGYEHIAMMMKRHGDYFWVSMPRLVFDKVNKSNKLRHGQGKKKGLGLF